MKWLLPPLLTLILLIAQVLLSVQMPVPGMFGPGIAQFGYLVIVAGVLLLIWGAGHFRKVRTNINTFRDPDVLVTGGPFRFTRNPMYLGFFLILFGAAIVYDAASALLPVAAFFAAANWWYIPFEEQAAEKALGEAYDDYRRRVRRWL